MRDLWSGIRRIPQRLLRRGRQFGEWLLRPLRKINTADTSLLRFVRLWLNSRGWRDLAIGIPAVVVFLASAVTLNARFLISDSELALQYRARADQALAEGDDAAAALWMEKVTILVPSDPDILYNQALVAAAHGDRDTARTIMKQLASSESSQTGRPEMWLAMDLTENNETVPADQIDDFHGYLTTALEREPDNRDIRDMMMRLEFSLGDTEAGIYHLKHLNERHPEYALLLARSWVTVGMQDRAVATAQAASHRFGEMIRDDPSDTESHIHRAKLEAFLEHFGPAVRLLKEPLKIVVEQEQQLADSAAPLETRTDQPDAETLAETRERLRLELSSVLVQWSNHVHHQDPENIARRLELLQEALDLSPHDPRVLESIALIAAQQNEPAGRLRDMLNNVLAEGRATPVTHLILSMGALGRGDRTTEEHHLRLALASNPNMPIAANNLAMLLAERTPPETAEALELVNHALTLDPDHPEIRATRGVIFAKAGRTHDAIIDMEYALTHLKGRPDLHAELSRLYDSINDHELATRHRALAGETTGSQSTVTHEDLHKQ